MRNSELVNYLKERTAKMVMGVAKAGIYAVVGFNLFTIVYRYTARKMVGWEDTETEEYKQKKLAEFEGKNPEEKVTKLVIKENYF